MARVTGKKGTLNEGVVGDVAVVDRLTDSYEETEDLKPADDPSADVERLAQAVVRGEVAEYSANPVDLEVVKSNDLEDRAHDVVLLADPDAPKGAHVGPEAEELAEAIELSVPKEPSVEKVEEPKKAAKKDS